MLISLNLFAAVAVAAVGALVLWSNRHRWVNRTVFTCSLHIALWLWGIYMSSPASSSTEKFFWARWATSISSLIPFHFWFVKEAIAADFKGRSIKRWAVVIWFVVSLALAVVPYTEFYIPAHSTAQNREYGPGYWLHWAALVGLYGILGVGMRRRIKTLTGERRLALQVWLGGGCVAAGFLLSFMVFNATSGRSIRLHPLVVLIYYTVTAFAITTYRIFDARQLLLIVLGRTVLIAAVAAMALGLHELVVPVVPEPFAVLVTTGLTLWFAAILRKWLDRVLHIIPEATAARQAAFAVAQQESKAENLENAFRSVLKGWGKSEHAFIISGTKERLVGGGVELAADSVVVRALRQLKWATPERLARERPSAERVALGEFLTQQGLGVVVLEEGPALTSMVGVGMSASRRPFTYPQVTQLMELASIIESALERAHFSVKVQHAEQLATVGLLGASLAHEIRNPLVSIKTFVQLLPTHHQDPAFRNKFFRLIGDEVGRIDQLTEQLLDLASPRTYMAEMIDLHPVLEASLDLVAAKASHKGVQLLTDLKASPDRAFTDASAAKQVMLNLCFNAIQAVETHETEERWVKIVTRNTPGGIEMAIADSGPGISEEIRPRLFQPFQTTKSTGFGLGLAICSDILGNLNASISVDPPEPGRGATFRVTFPCQPSLS